MFTKVITKPDSSKISGPDCIPVVFLKKCEHKLSYILAELFNMCMNESWYKLPPCCLLSVISKVFEKLVNNKIVDHLKKCVLFLISSVVLGLLKQPQMAYWLRCWIPNPRVPGSKPLGCSKVNSAFHPFYVDQLCTRNSWELNGTK